MVRQNAAVRIGPPDRQARSGRLLRRGRILEGLTLGWNVVGVVVLAIAAVAARSVALAGFGFDSLIEIGASTVVLWELSGTGVARQRRALRLIGGAFAVLACYLAVQSTVVLVARYHPRHSPLGIAWTALTALAMFVLAAGKDRTGGQLGNPVLRTEGRITLVDGLLASRGAGWPGLQRRPWLVVGRPARGLRARGLRRQGGLGRVAFPVSQLLVRRQDGVADRPLDPRRAPRYLRIRPSWDRG